jgi:hypothetical protein
MASRNEAASATPASKGVVLTAPTIAGTRSGGEESSSTSQFAGIDNPEALGILMDFIRQTTEGGTEEQKRQRAERNTEIQRTRALGGDYSKNAAFTDAANLMAQQLQKSLEANMPAISKSIQGAGTSASSMQGLLAQKLATESAQAAGALGAEQAKSYGNISAQLQGVLEALTRIDPSIETSLLKALELTKVSKQEQRGTKQGITETGQSGGGSYFQPIEDNNYGDYGFAGAGMSSSGSNSGGPGYGFVQNNDTGKGTVFQNGGSQTFDYGNAFASSDNLLSDLDQQYAEGWGYGD